MKKRVATFTILQEFPSVAYIINLVSTAFIRIRALRSVKEIEFLVKIQFDSMASQLF
jgi:hypothetical protein